MRHNREAVLLYAAHLHNLHTYRGKIHIIGKPTPSVSAIFLSGNPYQSLYTVKRHYI
jgi:hypothetical protein